MDYRETSGKPLKVLVKRVQEVRVRWVLCLVSLSQRSQRNEIRLFDHDVLWGIDPECTR